MAILLVLPSLAEAGEVAAFDLIGPRVEVTVTRNGRTLPIAEVPNLQAGDRVWIHPVLPDDQRARYLMVVAFLRGATNPPPDEWFTRAETWSHPVREEGVVVTVPQGAQQALIFLAPQTGGDFGTLRSAVEGKPGAFVRAAQDLQMVSLSRARLEKYLAAIRDSDEHDASGLHERALTLARSLSIKVDEACFNRPAMQQASCLMQNSDQLVLDDGHGQSMVTTLTQGAGSDLIGAISTTKVAGGGAYSPYVGVVVDLARLMENLHTAKYQYISSLALPQGDELHLRLNYPPSFHKPQSVIVIGLPAVQAAVPPALHAVQPDAVSCAQNPRLVLPADGAPMVYSSELAHHLLLHLEGSNGKSADVPVTANALLGGFVPVEPIPAFDWLPPAFTARVRGQWGFEAFDGPLYSMQRSEATGTWKVLPGEETASVAGQDRTVHLLSASPYCVESVTFRPPGGEARKVEWKANAAGLEVHLPLEKTPPGDSALLLRQYGLSAPSEMALHVYEEDCHLTIFQVHTGDLFGLLKGTCLGRVSSLELAGAHWVAAAASLPEGLPLTVEGTEHPALRERQTLTAHVTLHDGRSLDVPATVLPPRPRLALLSKAVESADSPIHLGSADDLPVDARLRFRLRSEQPANFARNEKIEVASDDGFFRTELSLENGGLMRQNAHTVVALLEISHATAASTFGQLRFRAVSADGFAGDWQELATLVRLPELTELRCAEKGDSCTLSGSNLFLIDSISADEKFSSPTEVSENLMDAKLSVPRPRGKQLFLRLRDDPDVVQVLEMPVNKELPSARREPASARDEKVAGDDRPAAKTAQEKPAAEKPAEATPPSTPMPAPIAPPPQSATHP